MTSFARADGETLSCKKVMTGGKDDDAWSTAIKTEFALGTGPK